MSGDFKSMNELLGDQISHGERMGFKSGGHVVQPGKNQSAKMNPMDSGLQRRKKSNASSQREKEFGDQGPLEPGFKKGGKAKKTKKKGGRMKKAHGGKADKGHDEDYAKPKKGGAYGDYNSQRGASVEGGKDKKYLGKKKGGTARRVKRKGGSC